MDVDYVADLTAALTDTAGDVTGILGTAAPIILGVTAAFVGFRVIKRFVSGLGR